MQTIECCYTHYFLLSLRLPLYLIIVISTIGSVRLSSVECMCICTLAYAIYFIYHLCLSSYCSRLLSFSREFLRLRQSHIVVVIIFFSLLLCFFLHPFRHIKINTHLPFTSCCSFSFSRSFCFWHKAHSERVYMCVKVN